MGLDTSVDTVKARGASSSTLTDGPEDISGGVTASMSTGKGAGGSATLYLSTEGAIGVTIEFSPDGSAWYEPAAESPIGFDAAGDDVAYIEFDAAAIRVTGSNTTPVDLDLRVTA